MTTSVPRATFTQFLVEHDHLNTIYVELHNPIPGGGGYGKFAYPSADLIFRIEEKFFTAPFF